MTSRRNKMGCVRIRPYEAKDKEALTDICKETAWESYKEDPQKLATVPINFLDYFLEYEPSHVLVAADSDDRAVGYIECTTSYSHFVKTTKQVFFSRLEAVDPSQIPFEKRFLFALHFIRRWPAHLHINLTAEYQHQGLGTKLIDALIDQLKKEGFTRLAICGVERGSANYGFYRHYGFKEIWVYSPKLVSLGIRFKGEKNMKIEHVCLNVKDIEKEKDFYVQVFGFKANKKYHNDKTGWENYFLTAPEGGARLELLSHADMPLHKADRNATCIVHLSISLGSEKAVDTATMKVRSMGLTILGEPRVTGDGYYESSFLDPEGNMIELTK